MATQSGAVDARVIRAYEESFAILGPTRPALGPRRLGEAPQRPHAAAALDGDRGAAGPPRRARRAQRRRGRRPDDAVGAWRFLVEDPLLEGWQQIFDARLALVDLYTPETLATQRLALREEARDALSKGRLRAMKSLLGNREALRGQGLILAVAIAAGFSERLLTNTIAAAVPSNGGK
jgi:hypothetical protein